MTTKKICKNCGDYELNHLREDKICPTFNGKKFEIQFVYPKGHNWEGLTPEQVNEAYDKIK